MDTFLLKHWLLPIIVLVLKPERVFREIDNRPASRTQHFPFMNLFPNVFVPIHLNWNLRPAPGPFP